MRRATMWALLFAISFAGAAWAGPDQDIAAKVIAITKAQWAADMAKDTAAGVAILADDYTEFNGDYPVRLDGKALSATFYEATNQAAGQTVVAEMANEKVQVYGDVAILTYNYVGATKNKDGEVKPNLAKSTRVYALVKGEWKLVHANFAPVSSGD